MAVGDGLREAVQRVFGPAEIVGAASHPMQSSCALTRLELLDGAGTRSILLAKDLSGRSRHPAPPFMHAHGREIEVYETLLDPRELGTPRFLGAHVEAGRDSYWLFLEAVDGVPLWQAQDPAAWNAAASWLAALHRRAPAQVPSGLLHYDEAYFDRWMARALTFAPDAGLPELERCHRWAIGELLRTPATLVHGDFYPANVLIRSGAEPAICPVDFELAGIGPGVLDLAALVTGLPEDRARSLVDEYARAAAHSSPRDRLDELLLCARLHLAVRWLGWLPGWQAPEHQAYDWAREAHTAATALGDRR
jgi:aminoglycoside phosphotransferase (APT) family kinase protein